MRMRGPLCACCLCMALMQRCGTQIFFHPEIYSSEFSTPLPEMVRPCGWNAMRLAC